MYDYIYTQKYTKHYNLFPIKFSFHSYIKTFMHIYEIFITTYISIDILNQINLIKNVCWRKHFTGWRQQSKTPAMTRSAIEARTHAGQRLHGGSASGGYGCGDAAYRSGWPASTVRDPDRGAAWRAWRRGRWGQALRRVGEEMCVGEGQHVREEPRGGASGSYCARWRRT
jgi:hypothetical protein